MNPSCYTSYFLYCLSAGISQPNFSPIIYTPLSHISNSKFSFARHLIPISDSSILFGFDMWRWISWHAHDSCFRTKASTINPYALLQQFNNFIVSMLTNISKKLERMNFVNIGPIQSHQNDKMSLGLFRQATCVRPHLLSNVAVNVEISQTGLMQLETGQNSGIRYQGRSGKGSK